MMKVNVNNVLLLIKRARIGMEEKDYKTAEYHLICLENAIRNKMKEKGKLG